MSTQHVEGNVPEFDLADRMRKALRESGVGVQEIADELGVKRGAVGTWINGKITPDRRTLIAWALRTGVPFKWLETGETPNHEGPGPNAGSTLPHLDSNQEPAGYRLSQVRPLAA